MKKIDAVIIGAGPAGIGAGEELLKNNISFVIIEKSTPGGKVNIAPRVDNYPKHAPISGPDLAYEFYQRMKQSKMDFVADEVLKLTKEKETFVVECQNEVYHAKAVLIASGTVERKLGLDKEEKLVGHGISYCAICDGHFYKNKDILVAGGGNSALKEAIYLSHLVSHLYLIHRRNQFRGNLKLVDELKKLSNVTIMTPYVPLEILGEDKVEGIRIKNVETEQVETLKVEGFFPLVGQIPNTQYVMIPGVKNDNGTIPFIRGNITNVPGLFASGDVLDRELKQIYLSEHDGIVAAKSIVEYLK